MPRTVRRSILALAALSISVAPASAQDARLAEQVDRWAELMNEQVIAWRRDIHANPELGMQEFRTAALVAEHLESLGIEVETGVGGTGVGVEVALVHAATTTNVAASSEKITDFWRNIPVDPRP